MANNRSIAPWRMREGRQPFPGESLEGYIAARTADENIPTTLIVTSLAGEIAGHRRGLTERPDDAEALAACLRTDAVELRSRAYPEAPEGRRLFFGMPIDRRMLEINTRRFSPASLVSSPHHRASWNVRVLPLCTESWEVLTTRCPSPTCGEIQRWHRANGVDRCDRCAETLTRAQVDVVPDELRAALRCLARLVDPDPARRPVSIRKLPRSVRRLGPGPILELAAALAGVVDPTIRMPNSKRLIRKDAEPLAICRAMAEAWRLLRGWPRSFEVMISQRLAVRDGRFGDGNADATLDFLDLTRTGSLPVRARTLIERFGAQLRHNREAGYDLKEAAAKTGLPVMRLAELRRRGVLPTVFHLHGDRPQPLLDADPIVALSEASRASIGIENAAMRLGISYHGVEQLLCLGLLDGTRLLATRQDEGALKVVASSVERLRRMLQVGSTRTGCENRSLEAAVEGLPGQKAWGSILQAMLRGRIRFAMEGDGPLAKCIRLEERDVLILRGLTFDARAYPDFDFASMMTKSDALAALNVHQRYAVQLLGGWLSKRGSERTMPVAEVDRLAAEFLSPRELAVLLGTSARTAMHLAERAGVRQTSPAGFPRHACEDWVSRRSPYCKPSGTS